MPDGSLECRILMDQLREIKEAQVEHATWTRTQVEELRRLIDELRSDRDIARGESKALWKVGAGVMSLMTLLGWLAVNGVPHVIKDALK